MVGQGCACGEAFLHFGLKQGTATMKDDDISVTGDFSRRVSRTPFEQVARLAAAHAHSGYDYSRAKYFNAATKVEVICGTHGSFWQTPSKHIKGSGCPECAKIARYAGSLKQRFKELGRTVTEYQRALKRRQAGMPDEKVLRSAYVRSEKATTTAVTVHGVEYPNIRVACGALNPPANETTILRWLHEGKTAEEAFCRVPNPGFRNGIIYRITHVASGKSYIGLTVQSLPRRWKFHLEQAASGYIKGNASLHAAIRKFGPNDFEVVSIDRGTTKIDLEAKERHWIATFGTLAPRGFNLHPGGVSGGSNAKPTQYQDTWFPSVLAAATQIAADKGISLAAAKRRLLKGRIEIRTPAKPGQSLVKTKVYKAWSAMVHGSLNPKSKDHLPGVSVNESWRRFDAFLLDVGQTPSGDMCFARIDKSGDFTPENCRWMTKSEASKINAAHMKATGRLTGRPHRN